MTCFVLVHGGMCGGWVWDEVAAQLRAAGHGVHVIEQLPSGGQDPTMLGDLYDDADAVGAVLDWLADPAVLVGHSYAGMVLHELANHPMVEHACYLTAVWPQRGQSLLDLYGGALPRALTQRDDGTVFVTEDVAVLAEGFGRGMDLASTERMLERLVPQSMASITSPSNAPVRTHPTTYLIATEENEPSVAAQEAWSTNADHVARLPGAHMLMLYRADAVAQALAALAE